MTGDKLKVISGTTRKNKPACTKKSKRHLVLHKFER